MGPGWRAAHRLSGRSPRYPEAGVPVAGPGSGAGRLVCLAVPAGVGFGDGEAEGFELGDELAQAAVVVEPGAVVGELVVGEDAGGGLAVFLAGPLVVGAVAPGRVGVAAAARERPDLRRGCPGWIPAVCARRGCGTAPASSGWPRSWQRPGSAAPTARSPRHRARCWNSARSPAPPPQGKPRTGS